MRNNSHLQSNTADSRLNLALGTGNVPSISILLSEFFDAANYDYYEERLSELLNAWICPVGPEHHPNLSVIANQVNTVREISTLLRKLEVIHNTMEGGVLC